MVPFFVQFKCKLGQSYAVANALAEAEIASEIYSTAGDYDLLVKFYVDNDTDIGHFVNEKVQVIPGIQDTKTILTFRFENLAPGETRAQTATWTPSDSGTWVCKGGDKSTVSETIQPGSLPPLTIDTVPDFGSGLAPESPAPPPAPEVDTEEVM